MASGDGSQIVCICFWNMGDWLFFMATHHFVIWVILFYIFQSEREKTHLRSYGHQKAKKWLIQICCFVQLLIFFSSDDFRGGLFDDNDDAPLKNDYYFLFILLLSK